MTLRQYSLLVCAALGGCATPLFSPTDEDPAPTEADPDGAFIRIAVAPRLGKFHDLVYASEIALNDPRIGQAQYLEAVDPSLRRALSVTMGDHWTLLAQAKDYHARRAKLEIVNGPHGVNCTFNFPTLEGLEISSPPDKPCEATVNGLPNKAVMFGVTLAREKAESIRLRGEIPEDFLIVSLGDSFASGEGNPDRPIRGTRASKTPRASAAPHAGWGALWMDGHCHRSAWAGPVQAGLRLGRQLVHRSKQHIARGHFTVLSLACSGATVNRGLIGEYEGAVPYEDFVSSLPEELIRDSDKKFIYFDERENIPPQIKVLEQFLSKQQSPSKRAVDVLTISVGGNDAGFAGLVKTLVYFNLEENEIGQLQKRFRARIRSLLDRYESLAEALQRIQTGADGKKVEIRQALATAYPNPLLDTKGEPCVGRIASQGLIQEIVTSGKRVTQEESALVRNVITKDLNDALREASERSRWRFVIGHAERVHGKGVCDSTSFDEPYPASPARLFRLADETLAYQGNVSGLFHPNAAGHAAYAGAIKAEVADSLKRPLEVSVEGKPLCVALSAGAPGEPRACDDAIKRGELGVALFAQEFALKVSDENGKVVDSPPEICVEAAGRTAECASGSSEIAKTLAKLLASGRLEAPRVRARHPHTQREHERRLPTLVRDVEKPRVECRVGAGESEGGPCDEREPSLWRGNFVVLTGRKDSGVGVANIAWCFAVDGKCGSAPGDSGVLTGNRAVVPAKHGRHRLFVTATDLIGNSLARTEPFGMWGDTQPPRVAAIGGVSQGGYAVSGDEVEVHVAPEELGEVTLEIADDDSGIAEILVAAGPLAPRAETLSARCPRSHVVRIAPGDLREGTVVQLADCARTPVRSVTVRYKLPESPQ